MQDSSQSQSESEISSGLPSKIHQNILASEFSSFPSENLVFTEKKYSSHNSYYLSYDDKYDVNHIPEYSTPEHDFKFKSAYNASTRSSTSSSGKSTESASFSGQNPLVASFEYSPSGKCIKSFLSGQSEYSQSFLSPDRTLCNKRNISVQNSKWRTFNDSSKLKNRFYYSQNKSTLQKSQSSNFVCSKCGLGYPCTLFLCKRATPSVGVVKRESELSNNSSFNYRNSKNSNVSHNSRVWNAKYNKSSISNNNPNSLNKKSDSSLIAKDTKISYVNSITKKPSCNKDISVKSQFKDEDAIKIDFPTRCSTLQCGKKYNSCSTEKSVENLISELFPDQNFEKSLNEQKVSKKNKVEHNESNNKPMKNTVNISINGTNNEINRVCDLQQDTTIKDNNNSCVGTSDIKSVLIDSSFIGFSKKCNAHLSDKSDVLSPETKNFLNELDASAASNNFNDYSLIPKNTLTSDIKIIKENLGRLGNSDYTTSSSSIPIIDSKLSSEIIKKDEDGISKPLNSLAFNPNIIDDSLIKSDKSNYISTGENLLYSTSKLINKTYVESSSKHLLTDVNASTFDLGVKEIIKKSNTEIDTVTNSLILDSRTSDDTVVKSVSGDFNITVPNSESCNEIITESKVENCISKYALNFKSVDKTVEEFNNNANVIKCNSVDLVSSSEAGIDYIKSNYIPVATSSSNLNDQINFGCVTDSTDNVCMLMPPYSVKPNPKAIEKTVIEFKNRSDTSAPKNSIHSETLYETITKSENNDCLLDELTLNIKTDEATVKSNDDYILESINVFNLDFKTDENTFKSKNCDYTLASNTSSTIVNEAILKTNDSETKMSVSNEGEEQCNLIVNKDLTNALELIEQSSLYDKDLSSAEICNSLNQIFNENDSTNLPASEESNSVCIHETPNDMESISISENNESENFLQSSTNVVADSENYINVSDFYLGDTPDNVQNILIIQDEVGNVETLYIIQNPEDLGEGMVAKCSNEQAISSDASIADNILIDNSVDELQNLLISQGIINSVENPLITEQQTVTNQSDQTLNAASLTNNEQVFQSNLDNTQNNFVAKALSIEKKTTHLLLNDNESVPIIEENDIILKPQINLESTLDNSVGEDKIATEDSSDKVENILLTLSEKTLIPFNINSNKVDNLKGNQSSKNSGINVFKNNITDSNSTNTDTLNTNSNPIENTNISSIVNSQNIKSLSTFNIYPTQKAKKTSSTISIIKNNAQESNLDFHKHYNALCAKSGDFGQPTGCVSSNVPNNSKVGPVNGAVFYSELSTDSNQVGNYCLSNMGESCLSSQFSFITSQKSKKTFPIDKLRKRSAKKTLSTSISSHGSLFNKDLKYPQEYVAFNSLFLKRGVDDEICFSTHKRAKKSTLSNFETIRNHSVALKTFKRPFTAAKKSVLDSRESSIVNFKNTALKTCTPKLHMKTALKSLSSKQPPQKLSETLSDSNSLSINFTEENMKQTSSLNHISNSAVLPHPEICEIRILPNDYIRRASSLLIKSKNLESDCPDESMSDEEVHLSSYCNSPLEEIMSLASKCSCTAQEVPCICNDNNLQLTCEAEDSMGENIVSCLNSISQQYLHTPSSEVKHRAFCDNHLWRLRKHHCCPKCGIFCSQGIFLLCSSDKSEDEEYHLFHTDCFLIPASGLPPSCPHCCKFSSFNAVQLIYKSSADPELKEVPFDSKNIARDLIGCDIFMTVHQTSKYITVSDSNLYTPTTNEVQEMITALAKEKALRLRPTGKCLFNPIKTGDVQKVMLLIGNGVDPNHKFTDQRSNTPLHVAAEYGWIGIFHILIQAGAMIDAVNIDLETPLILAVERNQLPIVKYIIHAGAQVDVKDCNGMTSFHIACKNGFREIAEALFNTGKVDVNLQDDGGGWTALMWSGEHKHKELTKWLLENGSDPNLRDKEKNTVLHWAAYSGESEIAKLFLEWGCALNYVNKRGDSALHVASRENNYECVKLLVANGALLDQKNKNGETPLMCCEDDTITFNFLCESISSGALKLRKMHLEKHVVFRDISRGAEAYPIQVINEVDNEEFIMEFRYIIKNCHRSGVDIISTVNNMRYCYCKDNCLTRKCSCSMNSKCWYDTNGCLSSEFDVFWPPIIYECNKTCHCPKTCINRVVQQGMRCRLQLFRTWYQGWGVRTLQDLPKGAFVCEYVGELITGSEATQRDDDTYCFDLVSQEADFCLDGRYFGNVARFLNHSCEPNLIAVKVFVDYQDLNFPRIAFFTVRHIKAFEELSFDYGLDFWIVKSQTILCTCNTPSCKYSKDTIDDTLQKFFMDTKVENETPFIMCEQKSEGIS